MNLSILKNELNKLNLAILDLPFQTTTNAGSTFLKFSNFNQLKLTLNEIAQLGLAPKEIDQLSQIGIFSQYGDSQQYDYTVGNQIRSFASIIQIKVSAIKEILNQNLPTDTQGILRIRLPKANDFEELADVFNDLKIALSLPVRLLKEGGDIGILTAEPGSIWIVLLIPAIPAMVLIADLVYCALFVKQEDGKNEQTLNLLSRLEDPEIEATIQNKQKDYRSKIISNEALGIANRNGIETTPENLEYLETSVKKIVKQYSSGAMYLPSQSNGAEIVEMFPSQEKKLIESKVKQLGEHQEKAS